MWVQIHTEKRKISFLSSLYKIIRDASRHPLLFYSVSYDSKLSFAKQTIRSTIVSKYNNKCGDCSLDYLSNTCYNIYTTYSLTEALIWYFLKHSLFFYQKPSLKHRPMHGLHLCKGSSHRINSLTESEAH